MKLGGREGLWRLPVLDDAYYPILTYGFRMKKINFYHKTRDTAPT